MDTGNLRTSVYYHMLVHPSAEGQDTYTNSTVGNASHQIVCDRLVEGTTRGCATYNDQLITVNQKDYIELAIDIF